MKTIKCSRSRLHGFSVDWIIDVYTDELILVVPIGDRLEIAPYNEEFELSFDESGKLVTDQRSAPHAKPR